MTRTLRLTQKLSWINFSVMIETIVMVWFRRKMAVRRRKLMHKSSSTLLDVHRQHQKRRYRRRLYNSEKHYAESNWAKMLAFGLCKDPASKGGKLFRRRFRLPYPLFEEIIKIVRERNLFREIELIAQDWHLLPWR